MRSTHTSLNDSLFKINIVDTPLCVCGEGVDTLDHIFWKCKQTEKEREIMLLEFEKLKLYGPYSITNILSEMNSHVILVIANFINKINIKI